MTRERPIPCRGATLQESIRGSHKTWADDGYCTKCRVLAARSIAAVRANHPTASSAGALGLVSSASGTRSVDGTGPATFAAVASSDHGTALARSSGTFGDGFLSGASPRGAALTSVPSRGTGPIEGRSAAPRPT